MYSTPGPGVAANTKLAAKNAASKDPDGSMSVIDLLNLSNPQSPYRLFSYSGCSLPVPRLIVSLCSSNHPFFALKITAGPRCVTWGRILAAQCDYHHGGMAGALQILLGLAGIAALVLLFSGLAYLVGWLVGLGLRYAPLVGRRHRKGPLVGRDPIETESSKHWTERRP
jgi:hypothetical protein